MWHGPESMVEDEQRISKMYQRGSWYISGAVVILAALTVAGNPGITLLVLFGFISVVAGLIMIEARLYDLCIRLRRTNILLSGKIED